MSIIPMLVSLIVVIGFAIGAVVGRWWALLAAVAWGGWIWKESDVEVPSWFLGLAYGGMAALAIAVGVAVRRRLTKA